MEKNYYEWLEIDKNASSEIIEKAYKTLVKKYHPDLQKENNKLEFEQKLKEINKAYEILSNPEKKKIYDDTLKSIENEQIQEIYEENQNLKTEINNLKNNLTHNRPIYENNNQNNYNLNDQNDYYNYQDNNYNNTYHKHNYTFENIKYKLKKLIKNIITSVIAIIVIVIIFYILWHIPFIHNYLSDLYYNNPMIQFVKDLFKK